MVVRTGPAGKPQSGSDLPAHERRNAGW